MEVKEVSINEIKPYEKNPRKNKNAVSVVAKSIQEFGWRAPIVVDKDMVIICGHTRLQAAQKLKLKTVPIHIADNLTPEQVQAYRIADNKTGEISEWDMDLLTAELAELQQLEIKMEDFGFCEADQIEWSSVEDLTEESYKEPEKVKLSCPHCGHIDSKERFMKV